MINKILFMLIFIIATSVAQNYSELVIKVFDGENQQPIERVNISIRELNENFLTDKSGKTERIMVSSGNYSVSISHLGYKNLNEKIVISGTGKFEFSFSLETESILMNDVTVTSTRGVERESPFTFSNISSKELEKQALIKDIPFVLNNLPSTTIHSENGSGLGYSYLRIRGFDQRRISVLINGIPQNDPEDHNVYWINFYDLTSSLQDVQVQRGAGGAFYGPPSIGGSINLITKNFSSSSRFETDLGYGSFNTKKIMMKYNSGIIADKFILSLKGTHVTSDGYRDWAWTKFWRYFVGLNYFDSKNNLKLSFFGGPQEDGLAFYGIPKSYNSDEKLRKENFGSFLRDREYLNSPQISLLHDYKINQNLILHNSLFYISGDGYFDFDGTWGTTDYFRIPSSVVIPSDLIMRAYVNNDQLGWLPRIEYLHSDGRTILGAEIRAHRSIHWGRIQSGSGIPAEFVGDSDYHFYEYYGGKNIFSTYINHLHKIGNLSLSGDIRFLYQQYKIYREKYSETEFTTPYFFILPKFGINYNMNSYLSAYASFGYTRREPPLKNLYEAESASWGVVPQFETNSDGSYNFKKPLVKDEELFDYEIGVRFSTSRFRSVVNFFWMEFNNEIVPSGGLDVFGQPRVGNAEKTRHIGLELETAYRINESMETNFNISLSRNRYVKFDEYDSNGIPIKRDGNAIANAPELIFNGGVNYNFFFGHIGLMFNYTGLQYADNSQQSGNRNDDAVTVDPYIVFNLLGTLNIPYSYDRLKLQFEVNNLFNKKYLMNAFGRDNFFPAAERNFFITMKFGL